MYQTLTVNHFGANNSLINSFVSELRDAEIQKDSMRFRRNLERIGEIAAYEVSKHLEYEEKEVVSPLGTTTLNLLKEQPVLATILRAGLPMLQGVLNYFDRAESAFISAFRQKNKSTNEIEAVTEYLSAPTIKDKVLILADPMLATGKSMVASYEVFAREGAPKHTHVIAAIASSDGVQYVKEHFPNNTTFWIAAIDDELSTKSYIIPGLGDAGDLAYGEKMLKN